MRGARVVGPLAVFGAACLFAPPAHPQPMIKAPPMLVPIAETKLLMAGIADPNLKGLGKILKDKPTDPQAWAFARGQALLIAETGNLLLLRPPKMKVAQDKWTTLATELREAGAALGKTAAAKDYLGSRSGLARLANACNRCHTACGVPTRVNPFTGDGP